jgi:hypothetical protein
MLSRSKARCSALARPASSEMVISVPFTTTGSAYNSPKAAPGGVPRIDGLHLQRHKAFQKSDHDNQSALPSPTRPRPGRTNAHAAADAAWGESLADTGLGSGRPPDSGSSPDGTWNLSDLVNDLKQVSKLTGRGIRTDVDRVSDPGGLPGAGIEPACRGHTDSLHLDAQRGGLPVNVIEHAAGRCEVEKMAAGEIGFNRDAFGGPSVRESDGRAGGRPQRPSAHRDLEAIFHLPFLPTARETGHPRHQAAPPAHTSGSRR